MKSRPSVFAPILGAFLLFSTHPAYAGMFSSIGATFLDLGRSIVDDLGLPLTLCSVAYSLIAIKLRLGGVQLAVTGIIAGIALLNAENLVTAFWSAH